MFDIGFWELLVIAIVLLLVMGPERLPEVARQAAFLVRKARQGMFRLKNEMRSEIDGTPFADLQKAKAEMTNFKNDMKQFGRDLADSAEQEINVVNKNPKSVKRATKKKTTKNLTKKISKKTTKVVVKKAASKVSKKKTAKRKTNKKVVKKK